MRKPLVVALAVCVSLSIAGCKRKPKPTVAPDPRVSTVPTGLPTAEAETPPPKPSATAKDAAPTWTVFEPEPTKFTILFPGKPEQKASPQASAAGTMIQHEASASYRDSYYAIAWMDFPITAQVDTKKALDGARDGAVKGGGGRIRTEKTIKAGKATGRDIVFDVSSPIKATGYLRIYIAGRRFYQTLVVEPAIRPDATAVAKFLDSFVAK
jgi:hypothetical protein